MLSDNDFISLVGKTVLAVSETNPGERDEGIELTFNDGSVLVIASRYDEGDMWLRKAAKS